MADEPKEGAGPQEVPAAPRVPKKKNPVEERLKAAFGDAVETSYNIQDELEIRVAEENLPRLLRALRNDAKSPYDYLRNLTAVDWKDRFEVVYNICCTATWESVVVKCGVSPELCAVDTSTDVWPGANWLEREVLDLFGIRFRNHPDPRRIMLPEEWVGHPLRKDYVVPED